MRPLFIALATAVAAATVSLACGQDEEAAAPVPTVSTTPAGTMLAPAPTTAATPLTSPTNGYFYRWVNVTLVIPTTTDVYVLDETIPSGEHGIRVTRDTKRGDDYFSTVLINAETGTIASSDIKPEDSAFMDAIVASRVISPLDAATAPWPYNGEPAPTAEREVMAGLSYLVPPGETGWHVYTGIGDPGGEFIGMTNGRSGVVARADRMTGNLVVEFPKVLEEDRAPLERWLATVKICGLEIQC